jgi:hypothetical protein
MLNSTHSTCLRSDDTRRKLVLSEKGREYRVLNPNGRRLMHYQIDHCFAVPGKRCDHAIGVPELSLIRFVELKGKDLRSAAEQIYSTILVCESDLMGLKVHARVVLSRVQRPDLRSSDVVRLERKLAQYGGKLQQASRVMEEAV